MLAAAALGAWGLGAQLEQLQAAKQDWLVGAVGSTALCPTGGGATSARQLAASAAAVSYSALWAEANASSNADGAEPSWYCWNT